MTIRPTSSGQTPRPAIGRTERAGTPASPVRPSDTDSSAASSVRRDDVQISAQARELQQMDSAGRGPGGELSVDRLRQVLGRVNDGHYDQPDVQEQVVRRLSRDL